MASFRRNLIISILFVIFGGPGIILVYVPLWITHFRLPASEPLWQRLAAGVLIALGTLPLIESARRFVFVGRGTLVPTAPTEHLVVSGFYRHVRNPMYVGVVTALVGEAVLFEGPAMAAYVLLVWLGFHLFVCFHEEPALTRRYGEEYLRFKRYVPRWLPRLTPWTGVVTSGGNLSG
jgi:protein-S-isoprenylcysteine O-methyltransferase Ste14